MTLIIDMAALEERCVQCGMPWIQHPVDEEGVYGKKGDYYCSEVVFSIKHLHPDPEMKCPYFLYEMSQELEEVLEENWNRLMENPEEAVP